MRDQILSMVN